MLVDEVNEVGVVVCLVVDVLEIDGIVLIVDG